MFCDSGVYVEVVDDDGNKVTQGGGYLTITHPWPSMLRGIWGDPQRYLDTYWSTYEGRYFAGDGAKVDDDGYLWLLGRVDDVMNVSGHRISTAEVESALVDHPSVAEAAVVGATDETTGQAIIGYVILRGGFDSTDELREEIRAHVATKLGPIARPRAVFLFQTYLKHVQEKLCEDFFEMWRKAVTLEILQLWQTPLSFQLFRKAPTSLTKTGKLI